MSVTGIAAKGSGLTRGVIGRGVKANVVWSVSGGLDERVLFFLSENEARCFTAFFIGAKTTLFSPVFECMEFWSLAGGCGESAVARSAVEFSGNFFSSDGITGSELRRIGGVATSGLISEKGGDGLSFRFLELEVRHLDGLVMLGRVEEKFDERISTIFGGGVVERDAVLLVVDFTVSRKGVAGNAAKVVKVSAAVLGEGFFGSFGWFGFFEGGEVGG